MRRVVEVPLLLGANTINLPAGAVPLDLYSRRTTEVSTKYGMLVLQEDSNPIRKRCFQLLAEGEVIPPYRKLNYVGWCYTGLPDGKAILFEEMASY